jgi:hypothetical protein
MTKFNHLNSFEGPPKGGYELGVCNLIFSGSGTFWHNFIYALGAHGRVVGEGTVLQAGRSRVRFQMGSLYFSIDLILLAALWSCGGLSL